MTAVAQHASVLVLYYSRFGVVEKLAEAIAAGVGEVPGATATLLEVAEEPLEQLQPDETRGEMGMRRATVVNKLAAADAIIVGAPAYFGSMASPVKRLFEDCAVAGNPPVHDRSRPWYGHLFRDKVGAAFTASATVHGGNEQALQSMLTMFMHLGMLVVTPGQHEPILEDDSAPYGATAIAGADGSREPDAHELAQARALGRRVAELTTWLRLGRTEWERWRGEPHPEPAQHLRALPQGGLPRPSR